MEVGIGLPATIPGVEGHQLTEWARRADAAGFSSLGVIDRVVYPNYEPLIALAAAAAVTERIRLTTAIILVPNRANAALVAKQAATIHHLSGGRLVLGVAVGVRPDDYEVSGVAMEGRGTRLEEMLDEMKRLWAGEKAGYAGAVGPSTDGGPPVLVGGAVDAAYRRAATYGVGWIMGGGTPEQLAQGREKTEAAWREAGRDGSPRIAALAYYALGDDAEGHAQWYLKDYYAAMGDEVAGMIAGSAATDADTVRQYMQGFADAGCDELIFFPCSTDPQQVDRLAEVALT
jgi:alkanesulfonate monooxygenase SsuD/methylene tetrahydromethanopterin reductase-like flavin-dependent oxidoreductase (luciferase family)